MTDLENHFRTDAQRRCEPVAVGVAEDGTEILEEVCTWAPKTKGFASELGIEFLSASSTHAEGRMPITDKILQPFGFVHGVPPWRCWKRWAAKRCVEPGSSRKSGVFGIRMDVRHKKSGKAGFVRGVADLEHEERGHAWWRVVAYDDEGDVMSEGIFETKRVSLAYLAEKEAKRQVQRSAQ